MALPLELSPGTALLGFLGRTILSGANRGATVESAYNRSVKDEQQKGTDEESPAQPDTGLRQLLTYTFIALVVVLLFAIVAVDLVMRWWGPQP